MPLGGPRDSWTYIAELLRPRGEHFRWTHVYPAATDEAAKREADRLLADARRHYPELTVRVFKLLD